MKFSAQEEYGLRCLLQIGRRGDGGSLTIPEIAEAEGLTQTNVAKLMQVLRRGGLVKSSRGQTGGYQLARPAREMLITDILGFLGGRLWEPSFCDRHAGTLDSCTHTVDCSIRSLWFTVQTAVDKVLAGMTLQDLLEREQIMASRMTHRLNALPGRVT